MRILKYLVILSTIFASSISSAGTLVVNSNQSVANHQKRHLMLM